MKQKRHGVDQIIPKLRRADVELGKGQKVPEVCKLLGITEQTYYLGDNPVRRVRRSTTAPIPLQPLRSAGTVSPRCIPSPPATGPIGGRHR